MILIIDPLQVQVLVEKDRNLDLKHALEVAASVQSLKIDPATLDEVSIYFTVLTSEVPYANCRGGNLGCVLSQIGRINTI